MAAAPERHKWLFRFLAVTLIPLLFFGSAELGLRLADYGYPTRFFQKSRMGERVVLVENEKFGRRFFPPSLAREPRPLILAPEKPADTFRIFVFGESAAMGDPEPAYGFSRILEVLLRERFPGRRFEVVNVAMTAINSHAILPLARECARLQGDVWLIYMGNNEVEGPFGSGTIFGPKAPGLFFIRASLALKAARIGQLLDDLQSRLLEKTAAPTTWGGMKMFMEHQIRQEDPGMEMVYRHFQSNLEDIVQVGRKSGAKILVSTVGSNLRHCAPFASLHAAGLKETDQSAWEKMYASGVILESAGQFQEALAVYQQAARIDDRYAELQFRMGRCSWETGIYDQARRSFERARDLDTLRFRADSRLNEIIRHVGGNRTDQGVFLVDAEETLARKSPNGIPGRDLFYEHVHLNFDGNYLLARLFAERLAELLPDNNTRQTGGDWASPDACARRLAFTEWNRHQIFDSVRRRLSEAPFSNQLDHVENDRFCQEKMAEFLSQPKPERMSQASEIYRQALTAAPSDRLLHENFARLLEAKGDLKEALAHWQRVIESVPHHPAAYYQAGSVLFFLGQIREAQAYFDRALGLKPNFAEALNGTGLCLASQGNLREAKDFYARAILNRPEYMEARLNLAGVLQKEGKGDEAVAQYREVLRLKPGYWQASYKIGIELARRGKDSEAEGCFAHVVQLRPDYASGHFNLGVVLAQQKRMDQAIFHFREALRLEPANRQAQQYLEAAMKRLENAVR